MRGVKPAAEPLFPFVHCWCLLKKQTKGMTQDIIGSPISLGNSDPEAAGGSPHPGCVQPQGRVPLTSSASGAGGHGKGGIMERGGGRVVPILSSSTLIPRQLSDGAVEAIFWKGETGAQGNGAVYLQASLAIL
jgi:hypothetical protein